jgi:hypothetical protein
LEIIDDSSPDQKPREQQANGQQPFVPAFNPNIPPPLTANKSRFGPQVAISVAPGLVCQPNIVTARPFLSRPPPLGPPIASTSQQMGRPVSFPKNF